MSKPENLKNKKHNMKATVTAEWPKKQLIFIHFAQKDPNKNINKRISLNIGFSFAANTYI